MPVLLYIAAAVAIAYGLDRLRAREWDLDITGYLAALLALVALSGVLGPTLDKNTDDADKIPQTHLAAKE